VSAPMGGVLGSSDRSARAPLPFGVTAKGHDLARNCFFYLRPTPNAINRSNGLNLALRATRARKVAEETAKTVQAQQRFTLRPPVTL
jgi:hypothetical protein